ncbi:hypothetical protein APX70_200458 [Pseudomonas syringae pv. maculicola]|uniref:Uncharacterized protein n=1 Tax=Pseudomonas syringae pv. maculicola TaxID=59511 RepID=A0A3M2Y246_PSEYM|nr:hypothetical protein APX70_200458 [Pseudomonas syringae pv. maculicola]
MDFLDGLQERDFQALSITPDWQTTRPGRSCKTFNCLPLPSLAGPFNEALFSFR